jgi:hypothetical protein
VPGSGNTSRTHAGTPACSYACSALGSFPGSSSHEFIESKVAPRGLLFSLCCALDAKGGVLVRHDIIFVFGIDGLQVRRDVNVFRRELRRGWVRERLEKVRVVRVVHVQVCGHGIACLVGVSFVPSWTDNQTTIVIQVLAVENTWVVLCGEVERWLLDVEERGS